jgi:hypothetical protein
MEKTKMMVLAATEGHARTIQTEAGYRLRLNSRN